VIAAPTPPTLGQRLLRTVLLPLGVTWIVGAVVSLVVAHYARDASLRQLMLYLLLPQVALLALLAAWLRRSIARDLQGLDRSIRAQNEFAGNVAHELRTPLAGIRALAAYGLGHSEPAVWREQLRAIAASEARASRLVDRLLALALAAEAESRLLLAPIALDAAVREAVLRFLHRADEAGVDLGARGIDAPVWVLAEPMLLEGILNNLIDNALRYGVAPGAVQPVITVSVEQRDAEVILSVQDNGPGAPHEQQFALIDRGMQGDAGQLLGQGAGLGLALVAQYARLMNARMSLTGGPQGRGWVCEIIFPGIASMPEAT
jgi:two-component system sensor histidine kinase TctE